MASSLKKVVLRKWSQEWLPGYLPAVSFIRGDGLELLDLAGKIQVVQVADLKWACFVRDFNSGDITSPERLVRKTFAGRPRTSGLWIRTTLSDGDVLEGIAENDISLVTAHGVFLVPPDTRSNTQRVFLPAGSIAALEVLSVIGASAKPVADRKVTAKPGPGVQPDLF
jgi:hypothetical protein